MTSALDPRLLQRARELLTPPIQFVRVWPVLAAAAACAVSSVLFAVAMVVAPPLTSEHTVRQAAQASGSP